MAKNLQLKKGGILYTKEWDIDNDDFVEEKVLEEDFAFHFYDTICFDKDVKLRDFFLMVAKNLDLCIIVSGCPFIEDLIQEVLSTPTKSRKNITALRLYWNVFVDEDEDGEALQEYIGFQGVGDKEYPIEFTPINKLSIYPIILDETYDIKDDKGNIRVSLTKRFTLIDLIRGIVDELSYMGPPEMREFAYSEIKKNGEIEILTAEDIKNRLEERMETNKRPCSICGKDARSPSFKPNNICSMCYNDIKEN